MTYRNSPYRQSVPLHVAQRIEADRDALAEEVRHLRGIMNRTDTNAPPAEVEVPALVEDVGVIRQLSRRIQELEGDLERANRRTEAQGEVARREQRAKMLSDLGRVLDSSNLALRMNPEAGPWRDGMLAIHEQLAQFVLTHGAMLTGNVGEMLDPHLHEAIAIVESPAYERGQIVEVHRPGIQLDDGTVARPAQVVVAA